MSTPAARFPVSVSDEEMLKRKYDYFLPRMVVPQFAVLAIGLLEGILVWDLVPISRYLCWFALLLLVTGYRFSLIYRYRRQTPGTRRPGTFWHRRLLVGTFSTGLAISLSWWLTWPHIHPFVGFTNLLILFGLITGAASADFWMKWGFRLFVAPILASLELIFALRLIPHFWIDTALVVLFAIGIDRVARFTDNGYCQNLRHTLQTEKITEELNETNRLLETELGLRQAAEKRMRDNDRELTVLFDSIPLFLAYVTPDLNFRRVNRTLADHFQDPAAGFPAPNPIELFGPEQYAKLEPHFRRVVQGETVQALPVTLVGGEFEERHFLAQCIPVNPELPPTEFILVLTDVTSLKTSELRLREEAHKDPLTALGNRRFFTLLFEEVCRNSNPDHPTTLLFLDLDGFKAVNDRVGHAAGDAILQELARLLVQSVRKTDRVFRLGGDELAILLDGIRTASAERIVQAILMRSAETLKPLATPALPPTLSIGAVVIDTPGLTAGHWMEAADQALYRSKRLGGNCCTWSSVSLS